MRRKYADYYYSIKHVETASRNNEAPVKYYKWFIRNKEGEVLVESEEQFDSKRYCELDCREAIEEHYY